MSEYLLTSLMHLFVLSQQSQFIHKINSNALLFENVVLASNEKLWTKCFSWLKFHYHRNDIIYIIKIYTANHSLYHGLVQITK